MILVKGVWFQPLVGEEVIVLRARVAEDHVNI